jgi:hypothetical protein
MTADIRSSGGTPTAGPLADMGGIPEYRPIDILYAVAGTALTYGVVYPQLEAEGSISCSRCPNSRYRCTSPRGGGTSTPASLGRALPREDCRACQAPGVV